MWIQSLGWDDPLEEGMATHSSTLAGRIPWTEEPGRLQSMGLQRVGHHRVSEHILILGNIAMDLGANIIQSTYSRDFKQFNRIIYSNGSYSESLVYPLIMVHVVSYSNSTGASTSKVGQHWLHLPLHGTLHSKQ